MTTLRDRLIEYIDSVPENRMTKELGTLWRMLDEATDAGMVVELLTLARGCAVDNLADVVIDPAFPVEDTAYCAMDVAAMHYLLSEDKAGHINIVAYL